MKTVFSVLALGALSCVAHAATVIGNPQTGSTITLLADSYASTLLQQRIDSKSYIVDAWQVTIEARDGDGTLAGRANVLVGGCDSNSLGPLGRLMSIQGQSAQVWSVDGSSMLDRIAAGVCREAPPRAGVKAD